MRWHYDAPMFTGIVQTVGTLASRESRGGDVRLQIATADLDMTDVAVGDSIAVAGCCLTVVALTDAGFAADVSNETLSLTTLGEHAAGAAVNLEKSLRLADRLGGHLVSGHIDGRATVTAVTADARSQRWTFELPQSLARYVAAKGSVTLDGTSLTINAVHGAQFSVNLVPHTVSHTTFQHRQTGAAVNVEVDMVARYVERLLGRDEASGIDHDFLARHGFA